MTHVPFWVHAAVRLVERFAADGESLAGDLAEEHGRGRSGLWVWWQAVGALVTTAWPAPPLEIRPLTLVHAQPDEASWAPPSPAPPRPSPLLP